MTARLGADRYVEPAQTPASVHTTAHQLTTSDGAAVAGILRVVPEAATAVVLMHPRQDFSHHVLVPELLSHGYTVWTQGTRAVGQDLTLLHEQALLDMAAGHSFLRGQGFENVVSVGHSGGAALAAFYLEQAALPPSSRLTSTPGGKPIPLSEAEMPLADGLIMMAPHPGQGTLLMRVIDPSVTDELDPMSVDPDLDPYNPDNGFAEPPNSASYPEDFIAQYREAQRARVARIDAEARQRVEDAQQANRRYKKNGEAADRRRALASGVITVHRTDADLRNVDLSLDPNERPYGSLFGRRPDLTNYGVVGFARVTTPEAWLSTWSGLSSRADLQRCLAAVEVPTLVVELTGDQACYPADAHRFTKAVASKDVAHVRVPGRHFGAPLRSGMTAGATLAGAEMARWLETRSPAEATPHQTPPSKA